MTDSPQDEVASIPCPLCDGRGGEIHHVCCGRGRAECCGEPDSEFEQCYACGGAGNIALSPERSGEAS